MRYWSAGAGYNHIMRKNASAKDSSRFVVLHEERSTAELYRVFCDRETGVSYLLHQVGTVGGLTPLLGPDGLPIVDLPTDA